MFPGMDEQRRIRDGCTAQDPEWIAAAGDRMRQAGRETKSRACREAAPRGIPKPG
ncbi:MAG: hypothetical protein IKQ24_00270 [Verrucomicrobia bacterium]|nr:hypothetical protein [Verrucomicrobiota bacterium]